MNKWVGLGLVVLLLVSGWWNLRNVRFTPNIFKPKFALVDRGEIRVPISASGLLTPDEKIEVKSEASGEVIAVLVTEGDFVQRGDRLVELDPQDERRNVQRAEADVKRARAILAQSKVAVQRARVNVESSEAQIADSEAQLSIALRDWQKNIDLRDTGRGIVTEIQLKDSRATADRLEAGLTIARANHETAKLAVLDAEQAVVTNEANVSVAETALKDAEERLSETVVLAPKDALVTDVSVSVGNIIQGGTSTFTGGTVLLKLADRSKVMVVARVDEADYGRVMDIAPLEAMPEIAELRAAVARETGAMTERSGEVQITVDAFPNRIFEGRIDRVEPEGKLNAGSSVIQFDVHIEVTDENVYQLALGAQAQVEFTVDRAVDVIRVPAEAVKSESRQRGVYLKADPLPGSEELYGKQFVPLQFGITDGTYTQVVRRLDEGDVDELEGADVYIDMGRTPGR